VRGISKAGERVRAELNFVRLATVDFIQAFEFILCDDLATTLKGIECHTPQKVCLAAYGTGTFS
jgi:hypothetical protein